MTMATGERFMNVSQVAEYLGVPRRRVRELVDAGELHARRALSDRRYVLIPFHEVEQLKFRFDQERGSGPLGPSSTGNGQGKARASAA